MTDDEPKRSKDTAALRELPSVDRLLGSEAGSALISAHGRVIVRHAVRRALDEARSAIQQGRQAADPMARAAVLAVEAARPSLRPVLNATGVVLHTNLGRAPLAALAARRVAEIGAAYGSLELDLETGARGSRQEHVAPALVALTGAEDALVVNNGAAAVLLVATALAARRDVVVSRGELVEIGGKFRVPDVIAACGARLVEVGTTNRTRLDDYARALGPQTAMLLKVHRSNFALVGFTEETRVVELVGLAARAASGRGAAQPDAGSDGTGEPAGSVERPAVVFDAGSGSLDEGRIAGADEPTIRGAVADGADLVCFSGDKLLGGPQAGIVVGKRALVARLRAHPLMRALRPGKLDLAALEATLALHRDGRAGEIPVWRAIRLSRAELERAARELAAGLGDLGPAWRLDVIEAEGKVGAGACPLGRLPGFAVAIGADASLLGRLEAELRAGDPPVVARIEEGALRLDPRTLLAAEPPERCAGAEPLLATVGRLVREAASRALGC